MVQYLHGKAYTKGCTVLVVWCLAEFSFMFTDQYLLPFTDLDECASDSASPCPEHTDCGNTKGSFTCNCRPGFTKEQFTCEGRCLS